jgi:CPA2 family monovalent cation:H+ antiporter-2
VRSIDEADETTKLEGHVVIVGFGLAGQFAARTLRDCEIPFVVLELNADNVRRGKELGLPVYYGDATSPEALHHAHLENARVVVLLMNDRQAAQRVVDTVKRVAPQVYVLMRTHYLLERQPLLDLGAHDVVAEEVEGAVEIIARMLRTIEIPRNVIDERIRTVRSEAQTSERKQTLPRNRLGHVQALANMKIECVLVHEQSLAAGASAVALQLRSATGALVLGVQRGDKLLEQPDPTVPFQAGDIVYFAGTNDSLARALPLFNPREPEGTEAAAVASS